MLLYNLLLSDRYDREIKAGSGVTPKMLLTRARRAPHLWSR